MLYGKHPVILWDEWRYADARCKLAILIVIILQSWPKGFLSAERGSLQSLLQRGEGPRSRNETPGCRDVEFRDSLVEVKVCSQCSLFIQIDLPCGACCSVRAGSGGAQISLLTESQFFLSSFSPLCAQRLCRAASDRAAPAPCSTGSQRLHRGPYAGRVSGR